MPPQHAIAAAIRASQNNTENPPSPSQDPAPPRRSRQPRTHPGPVRSGTVRLQPDIRRELSAWEREPSPELDIVGETRAPKRKRAMATEVNTTSKSRERATTGASTKETVGKSSLVPGAPERVTRSGRAVRPTQRAAEAENGAI
jgi:hypothetical protein